MQRKEPHEIFKEFEKLGDRIARLEIFDALQEPPTRFSNEELTSAFARLEIFDALQEPPTFFSNEELTSALIDDKHHPMLLEVFFAYCTKDLIAGITYEANPAAFKLISLAQQSQHRCYSDTFLDSLKMNISTSNPIKKDAAITSLLAYIALLELSAFLAKTPKGAFVDLKKVDILSPLKQEGFSANILERMKLLKASVESRFKQASTFGALGKAISADKKQLYNAIIDVVDKFSINSDTEKYMQFSPSTQIDSIQKLETLMKNYAISHNYTLSGKK